MLIFWVLQGLINITLVGLAVSYVIQRRRLLVLENQIQAALVRLESGEYAHSSNTPNSVNTALGSAISTLSERKASLHDSDTASLSTTGRYALAQKLLGDGFSISEIGKRTGISETELVLLRKLSPVAKQTSKNYEAH